MLMLRFLRVIVYSMVLNNALKLGGQCATFGTCLALISTKNRLKSLEVTINEASKFREIQPFSYFTKDY